MGRLKIDVRSQRGRSHAQSIWYGRDFGVPPGWVAPNDAYFNWVCEMRAGKRIWIFAMHPRFGTGIMSRIPEESGTYAHEAPR